MAQSSNSSTDQMTLAQWVQQLREYRGMTQEKMAESGNLPLKLVQDIEAGIEMFLSPAHRQRLARVLRVKPMSLKALEKNPQAQLRQLSPEAREQFVEEILRFPDEVYHCPLCQADLQVRLFPRRDLEDNPLVEVKGHCTRCLFRL